MSNCSKVATHFSKPVQAPWKLLKVSLMFSDMIITGKQAWKRHWRCSSHRNPVTPLARVCYSTDGFSLSFYLFNTSMTEQTLPGHWGTCHARQEWCCVCSCKPQMAVELQPRLAATSGLLWPRVLHWSFLQLSILAGFKERPNWIPNQTNKP